MKSFSFSVFLSLFILTPVLLSAQDKQESENKAFEYKGLIRAASTFTTGIMPALNITNIYLTGDLEYYLQSRISVRSETHAFLSTVDDYRPLKHHHAMFTGISYHLRPDKPLDLYVGFQPGIAFTQAHEYKIQDVVIKTDGVMNPLISGHVGMNYYASKFFHLFVNLRYINGKHIPSNSPPLKLNELRFSFGLGFNLQTRNLNKTKTGSN